mmetsp:Transcript_42799/g.67081  ORF Transcript_42799/g.67081 Transcript_42799/m.67081 type:complete len:214 (+) Transcript_42799:109-750(+)|eukprot:CAMPEP_0184325826 /NCGR_PEP_ID=MMETSP1049-20130417/142237_1 /TAXON_ID=77928 /ORGANISM="Proteomonas sulcata, Strain CCMP704" /LENGTH=213 /DNA_ID=CAMNT_0026647985 /DNA_START=478 /DNA_END=1119 /DNA_ORIENTATION=-
MLSKLAAASLLVVGADAFLAPAGGFMASSSLKLRQSAVSSLNMKIGVFYGTTTGNTEGVAYKIAEKFGVEAEDIASTEPSSFTTFDTLICGAPTWHTDADTERSGTDWDGYLYSDIASLDLKGKKVAFFGCGDSQGYGDNFCDAMGELHDVFTKTGASVIGMVPVADSVECEASKAIINDKFVGLATDEDNDYDNTDSRVEKWVAQLKSEGAE